MLESLYSYFIRTTVRLVIIGIVWHLLGILLLEELVIGGGGAKLKVQGMDSYPVN